MIVVMPMAGRGSRFTEAGFTVPKPFIPVLGKPMFLHALNSIKDIEVSCIIFIVLKEHSENFDIHAGIQNARINNFQLIELDKVTEGQLATVLTASDYLNTNEDILILSSDTYVESDLAKDILNKDDSCAGIISVADLPGNQWSFARLNHKNEVDLVAEKERISGLASTGLYYFSKGKSFLKYSSEIISKEEKTRNEYYVIPVYQKYINAGKKIVVSKAEKMWDMGTPAALQEYIEAHQEK